ncbi:FAD-dependent monooxygenase [Amycolatopsis cynarae]|uniref:FAD-dependent monooxygenase n=2 Tax=Amycolatopsis cynarae TaxID=2995223 RepID=A0ABY7BEF7_9PSEU|nr:FAD-dependent monooxygenase [Amycolatopsis sp. HUAS 11-8]WAL69622.1 FAD-dependent monooxygenase [Amycolatopsis sp. HUAS 11-8]
MLALWLHRRGFAATVVERAPALREGGQAVDFRGNQMDILRRSGLLEDVRRHQTPTGPQRVVDDEGATRATLPPEFFSGEVEILRGDLSRLMYERTKDHTDYRFGDWITSLREVGDGVEVGFAHAAPAKFDLVVGADGMHSGVRHLAFGPESRFRTDSGYHIAGFSAPNHLGVTSDGLIYNAPGRGVMVAPKPGGAEISVGFYFAAEGLDYDRHDAEQQKKIVHDRFRGLGWQVPTLLEGLDKADDLYFDSLCQMRLEHYSHGRVVLLGDAAWGAGPGGGGTGLAMMAAYVLAGELAAAGGDHRIAFARYEQEVRAAAEAGLKQAKGAGPFLAPATEAKIRSRNRAYRFLGRQPLLGLFRRMALKAANTLSLKDY